MDDLDVIRLAVVDNITRKSIARAGMEVKRKFGKVSKRGYLARLQVLPPLSPIVASRTD
jgi:hypothetical protein